MEKADLPSTAANRLTIHCHHAPTTFALVEQSHLVQHQRRRHARRTPRHRPSRRPGRGRIPREHSPTPLTISGSADAPFTRAASLPRPSDLQVPTQGTGVILNAASRLRALRASPFRLPTRPRRGNGQAAKSPTTLLHPPRDRQEGRSQAPCSASRYFRTVLLPKACTTWPTAPPPPQPTGRPAASKETTRCSPAPGTPTTSTTNTSRS